MSPLDAQALAVATAISGATLCWRCTAEKTSLMPAQLDEALIRLRKAQNVVLVLAACDACQRDTLLYRLGD